MILAQQTIYPRQVVFCFSCLEKKSKKDSKTGLDTFSKLDLTFFGKIHKILKIIYILSLKF
jgi:hypothetical protein